MTFLKLYLLSLAIFFMIDLVWLGFIAKDLYSDQLGFLMVKQIRWIPAILFYFIYLAGLTFFVILPLTLSGNWILSLLYGGFFGLVCYSTYDLSNLATLKDWPVKIVVIDLIWGSSISAFTSFICCTIASYFKPYFI